MFRTNYFRVHRDAPLPGLKALRLDVQSSEAEEARDDLCCHGEDPG